MQQTHRNNKNIVDENLITEYFSNINQSDEMLDKSGAVNPHWQTFVKALSTIGLKEMAERNKDVVRLLRENGVTYVVHGEKHRHRPWTLDPIPMIISNPEWKTISEGLIQRAELLNLILKDLYGEKKLIKHGLIPPEIVYSHPGFLRPCNELLSQKSNLLLMYAADLSKDSNGNLWVLNDRTQAPSGAGYALENRTVLARTLPHLFGDIGVHRLSFFFRTMRNRINEIAPHQKENPHVVVLTPGPYNETYFEHAYIASYLGYTLAQGQDLTVLDGHVWLKSLDGLQPVDVILRRVDDIYCDPLELRQDSQLGVAGLLEVIRQGNVAIVNPPGSSVMENPALIPFLPKIAQLMLNEELHLPSVTTWWCGEKNHLKYVMDNLEKLVIKTIYRQPNTRPLFGTELSTVELNSLRTKINAKPHLYVGQEYVNFTTIPSLIEGKLKPRRAILRSFLFSDKDSYVVMPGGLTRCEAEAGELTVSIQDGGVSKDTWILEPEPEQHISLWQNPKDGTVISEFSQRLSSRSAENLFWVGRYAERAEGHTRLLRITLDRIKTDLETTHLDILLLQPIDTTEQDDIPRNLSELSYLHTMLRSLTGLTSSHPGIVTKGTRGLERELLSIIVNTENNGSLVSTLQSMVNAAFAVRDRWSTDTWRVMNYIENLSNAFVNYVSKDVNSPMDSTPSDTDERILQQIQIELDQLMLYLTALSGLNAESMTQSIGWVSLDMGRRIERALQLIVLCRSSLVAVTDEWIEDLLLESILAAAESLITYRSRYRSALHLPTALEMLLLDDSNPRSLVYQLIRLQEHIRNLPREKSGYQLSEEEQLILEAITQLQLSNTSQLANRSEDMIHRHGLEKLLVRLAQILIEISELLTQTYFSHVQRHEQLVKTDT